MSVPRRTDSRRVHPKPKGRNSRSLAELDLKVGLFLKGKWETLIYFTRKEDSGPCSLSKLHKRHLRKLKWNIRTFYTPRALLLKELRSLVSLLCTAQGSHIHISFVATPHPWKGADSVLSQPPYDLGTGFQFPISESEVTLLAEGCGENGTKPCLCKYHSDTRWVLTAYSSHPSP